MLPMAAMVIMAAVALTAKETATMMAMVKWPLWRRRRRRRSSPFSWWRWRIRVWTLPGKWRLVEWGLVGQVSTFYCIEKTKFIECCSVSGEQSVSTAYTNSYNDPPVTFGLLKVWIGSLDSTSVTNKNIKRP
jgi:hypothetical protein